MHRRYFFYLFIIIIVAVFFLVFNNQIKPLENSIELETGWVLNYSGKTVEIKNLPFYTAGDRDSDFATGEYVFISSFCLPEEISDPLFFLPFIAGNGIRLYIDNYYIGQSGDLKNGDASIWNRAHVYSVPENLSAGIHEIKIVIYGLYEAGILSVPYLTDRDEGLMRQQFLYFYFQFLIELISGVLLLLSIIFILTGIITHENSRVNIFMGMFLLSIMIFILDYSYIDYIFVDYLVFKKLTISSIYMGMIFLINLINRLFRLRNNKFDTAIIAVNIIVLLCIIFIPGNMNELRSIYTKTNTLVILILIYIAGKIMKTKEKTLQTELIFLGIVIVFAVSSYDIIQLFLHTGTVFYTHIALIIFTIIVSAIAVFNIIEIHTLAAVEKGKAVTDSLTGVYNRRILNVLDGLIRGIYSVILIDMDRFKKINDTYGHNAGDMVLKKTAEIIQEATRETDYLIRYGGDEFLLVLPECGSSTVKKLEKRILGEAGYFVDLDSEQRINFSFSTGQFTAVSGENLDFAINKADSVLYQQKNSRKSEE